MRLADDRSSLARCATHGSEGTYIRQPVLRLLSDKRCGGGPLLLLAANAVPSRGDVCSLCTWPCALGAAWAAGTKTSSSLRPSCPSSSSVHRNTKACC